MSKQDKKEYDILITRSRTYSKTLESKSSDKVKLKSLLRHKTFLQCRDHHNIHNKWNQECDNCTNCIHFLHIDSFPNGKLPTGSQVMSYIQHLLQDDPGHQSSVIHNVSLDLILHWIYCNVYTIGYVNVKKKIEKLRSEYRYLKNVPTNKRTEKYWNRHEKFIISSYKLFDIKTNSVDRLKSQATLWGVDMEKCDHDFYDGMCKISQIGYCTHFVDRKWQLQQNKKEINRKRHEKTLLKSKKEMSFLSKPHLQTLKESSDEQSDIEKDYIPDEPGPSYNAVIQSKNDDMPLKYRHVRDGERKVKNEYKLLVHKLKAEYHLSERQCQGAITNVANILFGRKDHGEWKLYTAGQTPDPNTLPDPRNVRSTEPYVEAMILSCIVKEMMTSNSECVITYSNDGSSLSGTGNFIVQSFTINGKQRALPTLGIFTESKSSMSELEIATVKILSASVGYKYSEKEILEKIDFVMTDSAAHNIGIMQKVTEEFECNEIPSTIICNIHPLMMYQGKMKEIFQLIHDKLGHEKIKDGFLVDIDFKSESFIIKAIKCLTSFINSDFSSKPWNRQKQFDKFIHPKVNESISLKDHRFNRLFECCYSLVHHIDDIKLYLDKFGNVLNNLSILDRNFLDMELLQPIFCATSLVGLHITGPFMKLLMNNGTTYSVLLEKFPILFKELSEIKPENLLTNEQVFKFVDNDTYQESLPKECVLQSIMCCANKYKNEVINIISIILPRFAEGFALQRGSIFGFGPQADKDTGSILKISTADDSKRLKLEKAPVHNLAEERSVGYVNYELNIRGKSHLESVSKKMIINKSIDFLEQSIATKEKLKKFRKPAKEIQEIKLQWNEKLKQHEQAGYEHQEFLNIKAESEKYEILDYLKSQPIPGPFTKPSEITNVMNLCTDNDYKNKRLRKEVKYARMTSSYLKPTAAVFRLTRNSKPLSTDEYAENLISYLDTTRSCKTLTIIDLNHVLNDLSSINKTTTDSDIQQVIPQTPNQGTSQNSSHYVGEHIIAFWLSKSYQWYLGVIDKVSTDNLEVSYFVSTDNTRKLWTLPEDCEQYTTSPDQILSNNVKVNYMRSVKIKCKISEDELIEQLDSLVKDLNRNI